MREVVAQAVLTAHGSTDVGGQGGGCPIVRLYSAFETRDALVLELELMSRSDLFDELSTTGVLREAKTAAIVHQVGGREGGMPECRIGSLGVPSTQSSQSQQPTHSCMHALDSHMLFLLQVVRAVAFCAQHHIAHRDVKLSNIIFPLQVRPFVVFFCLVGWLSLWFGFGKGSIDRGYRCQQG